MRHPAILGLAVALATGCSDRTFVVSNVDGAPIEAGEHDVEGATAYISSGFVSVSVVLGGDDAPCRSFSLTFCEADAGGELFVPDSIPEQGYGCGPGSRQRGAVTAGFIDVCSDYAQWTAVRGEGRAEVDGEDVHLVFRAALEPEGFTPGTFEVELEVDAGPPDAEEGGGSTPPWVDRPASAVTGADLRSSGGGSTPPWVDRPLGR